jgi:hypothetical protein
MFDSKRNKFLLVKSEKPINIVHLFQMSDKNTWNQNNSSIKRIMSELKELRKNPPSEFIADHLETNGFLIFLIFKFLNGTSLYLEQKTRITKEDVIMEELVPHLFSKLKSCHLNIQKK